jgi:protein-L-isoaspartate(D-aspartate) O-methyltransferase
MSSLAALTGDETVLDVGSGSGYQAAVLSLLARRVVSVERLAPLADAASSRLAELGYDNVEVHVADGSCGWTPDAPYDAVVVGAGAQSVPGPLTDQLAVGGRLVIPVGGGSVQTLTVATRRADGRVSLAAHGSVVFVPLIGRHGWPD